MVVLNHSFRPPVGLKASLCKSTYQEVLVLQAYVLENTLALRSSTRTTSVPVLIPFLRPQLSHYFLTKIRVQLVAVVPQKKLDTAFGRA